MRQNIWNIDALTASVSAVANIKFQNKKYTLKDNADELWLCTDKNIKHEMVTPTPFFTSFAHKFEVGWGLTQ